MYKLLRTWGLIGLAMSLIAAEVASAQTRTAERKGSRGDKAAVLLRQRVPEIAFEEAPLDQVIDWLTDTSGMSIIVRWDALTSSGVDRDKAISVRARNLELSQILWLIMNQAGGTDLRLAYRASGEMLVLSTADDLGREMITRVYDISDLLIRAPRFTNAAQLDPGQALQQAAQAGAQSGLGGGMGGGGGGGGAGGGGQLFQGGQGGGRQEDGDPQADIERLISLITDSIEPETWQNNGGNGSVRAFRNLLVVHNTVLVHQRLAGPVPEGD